MLSSIIINKMQFNLYNFFELITERWQYRDFPRQKVEMLAAAIFEKAIELTSRANSKLVFLYLPTGDEMISNQPLEGLSENWLFKFCQDKSITCLSARPYLYQAYRNGIEFDLRKHYSPIDHKIIAEGLKVELDRLGLAQPQRPKKN